MTDAPGAGAEAAAGGGSAGALLREARLRQGLHIAALAAALKVPPSKLEALEHDRYDELPGMAFARALAQSVCRALKIEAAPVLQRLPRLGDAGLDSMNVGLKTPFHERSIAADPGEPGWWRRPLAWAVGALLLAAGLVHFLPSGWQIGTIAREVATAPAPAASAVQASVAASAAAEAATAVAAPPASTVVETVHSAPAGGGAAAAPAGLAVLRVSDACWVEVIDGGGRVLLSRTVQPGESVGLDGQLPMRLKIGNAAAASLLFRGQPVDLAGATRDNVARLELK